MLANLWIKVTTAEIITITATIMLIITDVSIYTAPFMWMYVILHEWKISLIDSLSFEFTSSLYLQ